MLCVALLLALPLSLVAQSWSTAEVATDEVYFVDARESKPSPRTGGDATSEDEGMESYATLKARVQLLESRLADAEARRLEDITKEMLDVAFEKESESQEIHDWMFIALFILLISLSIVFELGQGALIEKLERNSAHEGLLNVVQALQKELTLLGFVVLVATALQKTGGMQAMSDLLTACYRRTFGAKTESHADEAPEDEKEEELELAELFEDVHMLLFLIMVCFIMIVLILLTLAIRRQRLYDQAESKKTKDLKNKFRELGFCSCHEKINLLHKMQYRILRREFFRNAKKRGEPVRPASFKFSNYMGACMAEFIVQLIEIPIPTWFFLMVLVLCVKPFLALKHESLALGMVVTSLCLFLMLLGMSFMIGQTYNMCLPQTCPSYSNIDPPQGKSGHKTTPRYIDKMGFTKPRNRVEKYLRLWFWGTVSPTKQEQCFPFWKNGPRVNNFFIRLQVFGHAVFLGSYFRVLCVDPSFLANHWIAALIQWIPFLFGLRYVWPQLLYWNTIATCTGNSMNEKIMSRVIRQQTEATFRQYHELIYGINTLTRIWQIRCLKSLEEYASYVEAFVNTCRGSLENEEKSEWWEAFHRWDSDNNGIDREELSHVLKAYGMKPEVSENIAATWFEGNIFRKKVDFRQIDQDVISAQATENMSRKATTKVYDSGSYCSCCSTNDDSEAAALLPLDRDEFVQGKEIAAEFLDPRDANERKKNKINRKDGCHEEILFANEDEDAVTPFGCKDKLNEVEFEFLMMQQRDLDQQGCSAEKICTWLKKHVCEKDAPDTILPDHFLNENSQLSKLAIWCGIREIEDVHQLFLVVKNPDDEEEIINKVSCEDFAEWLVHTMHARSDYAEHGGSRNSHHSRGRNSVSKHSLVS